MGLVWSLMLYGTMVATCPNPDSFDVVTELVELTCARNPYLRSRRQWTGGWLVDKFDRFRVRMEVTERIRPGAVTIINFFEAFHIAYVRVTLPDTTRTMKQCQLFWIGAFHRWTYVFMHTS